MSKLAGGFFIGLDEPQMACYVPKACISINRLRRRSSGFRSNEWIMDSGAFTELTRFGAYRTSVADYHRQILRWCRSGSLKAVVTQDYMCEKFVLEKTKLTVPIHQKLTVQRYDALKKLGIPESIHLLPVLQGYEPDEYVRHIDQYGRRLSDGMWVGVGSVCKRNSTPTSVLHVLKAIKNKRPDLRLHGFGLKVTALEHPEVLSNLHSADSMAWCYAAWREGRDVHDYREPVNYYKRIMEILNA